MKASFIVLEGPDGCGKSTQAQRLHARLVADGRDAVLTREPTDGPIGKLIRQALRHEVKLADGAMGPLYAADRADHAAEVLDPSKASGHAVICDRYLLSNLVYRAAEVPAIRCKSCSWTGEEPRQGQCPACGHGSFSNLRKGAIEWARLLSRGAPRPDLTIVLLAPLEVCAARRRARGGAPELFDGDEQQRRVHALYCDAERLLPGERVVLVLATGTPEEVASRVWQAAQVVLW